MISEYTKSTENTADGRQGRNRMLRWWPRAKFAALCPDAALLHMLFLPPVIFFALCLVNSYLPLKTQSKSSPLSILLCFCAYLASFILFEGPSVLEA